MYMYNYSNVVDMLNNEFKKLQCSRIESRVQEPEPDRAHDYRHVTTVFKIDPDTCKIVFNMTMHISHIVKAQQHHCFTGISFKHSIV
jgi:hypothetical protein